MVTLPHLTQISLRLLPSTMRKRQGSPPSCESANKGLVMNFKPAPLRTSRLFGLFRGPGVSFLVTAVMGLMAPQSQNRMLLLAIT